jgi:hypothetical protein
VLNHSRYICNKINKDEWVAALLYTFTGDWADETLVINVLDIYPITHADGYSFNGSFDFDYNYAIDQGYDIENMRIGLTHSHCAMQTFFSQPDMDELRENAKFHPFYLSLITNNAGDWTGKIAVHLEEEVVEKGTTRYKDVNGNMVSKPYDNSYTKPNIVTFDCKMQYELSEADDLFVARVNTIMAEKVKRDNEAKYDYKSNRYWDKYKWNDYDYKGNYQSKINFEQTSAIENEYITRFFTDAIYEDIESVKVFEDYDADMFGPDVFIDYMKKALEAKYITKALKEIYINAVLRMFNTSDEFSKNLRKDYEQFKKSSK